MEIMFYLLPTITAVALCPVMFSLLQDDPDEKFPFSALKFGFVGFCIAVITELLMTRTIRADFILSAGCSGGLLGEILALFSEIVRKTCKKEVSPFYDDGTPARFYITGDKHRNFDSVEAFCKDMKTRKKDILIILGDAGFNYYGDKRDDQLKQRASEMNITFFCIHGNKEDRPANINTYGKRSFFGGKVYYEPKYPNILFAIDSEIYNFQGKDYFVMGGAHSVDKELCKKKGLPYFKDEMPTPALMKHAEGRLEERGYKVHGVLTHTCPFQYLPTEMFITTRQSKKNKRTPKIFTFFKKKSFKPDIDRTTEYWLGELEQKLDYQEWFCGHYHIDKPIDKVTMMFHEIRPLQIQKNEN